MRTNQGANYRLGIPSTGGSAIKSRISESAFAGFTLLLFCRVVIDFQREPWHECLVIVRSMGRHLTTGSLRFLFANLQAHSPGMCGREKGCGYLYEAEVGLYLPDGASQLQIHRISAIVFVLGALIGSCRACLFDIVPSWRQILRLGLPRPPMVASDTCFPSFPRRILPVGEKRQKSGGGFTTADGETLRWREEFAVTFVRSAVGQGGSGVLSEKRKFA